MAAIVAGAGTIVNVGLRLASVELDASPPAAARLFYRVLFLFGRKPKRKNILYEHTHNYDKFVTKTLRFMTEFAIVFAGSLPRW